MRRFKVEETPSKPFPKRRVTPVQPSGPNLTPEAAGWVRKAWADKWVNQEERPSWEVWQTPEKVLMVLPPNCGKIRLVERQTPRGVVLVCTEPEGVHSLWIKPKKTGENAE